MTSPSAAPKDALAASSNQAIEAAKRALFDCRLPALTPTPSWSVMSVRRSGAPVPV